MKSQAPSGQTTKGRLRAKRPGRVAASTKATCPIVGIGASAGGLEALQEFLKSVPAECGIAFVIVQHLDPTHKGIMPELLQHATGMSVLQVRDRTRVRPDHVYVIPPNKDMSLLQGVLHLLEPGAPRGQRLPVDFFFRSLAQDQAERGIGVILSGMGSDGTLGLRALKEKAGVAFVQDPSTARFDGMPRSAVDAGLADIVAPVAELPEKILSYLRHVPLVARKDVDLEGKNLGALEKAVILLRAHTGQDFTLYKKNTLCRRIERRMALHRVSRMADYVRYLQENSQELDLLFKELLIGVTSFFRDPAAWDQLRDHALKTLLAERPAGRALRAWVPGCSTGEEAYSLAIAFREAVEKLETRRTIALQIFATDLDRDAIDKARQGLYSLNIAADVSPERLRRYFVREDHGYRIRKEIREMVIFASQNLIMDAPFTKLDVLSCRNLLIYFSAEVQQKLIPLFHFSLNPGGILFLGSAETTGAQPDLFVPLCGRSRLFRRSDAGPRTEPVEFPSTFGAPVNRLADIRPPAKPPATLQSLADHLVLQNYAPPAVLVSDKGDIFYVSGRTGKYLEPASGKANWNVIAMAREGLRSELACALQKVHRMDGSLTVRGLRIGSEARDESVNVTLQRLSEPGPLQGLVMIVFADVADSKSASEPDGTPHAHGRHKRVAELQHELRRVQADARATQEEMQTAHEELRSANEELQSTNEELQSTNEELTTSREEMQSLNEELQTLNAELQAKLDELSRASSDMKNLLDSTDIATLFLDRDLNVRRFTAQTTSFIKLIPGDLGRPISDLVLTLDYPELVEDAASVLRTLATSEKLTTARDGRWLNVRILPYRTLDDRIDGVVITFTDVTAARGMEPKVPTPRVPLPRTNAPRSGPPEPARPRSRKSRRPRR